ASPAVLAAPSARMQPAASLTVAPAPIAPSVAERQGRPQPAQPSHRPPVEPSARRPPTESSHRSPVEPSARRQPVASPAIASPTGARARVARGTGERRARHPPPDQPPGAVGPSPRRQPAERADRPQRPIAPSTAGRGEPPTASPPRAAPQPVTQRDVPGTDA